MIHVHFGLTIGSERERERVAQQSYPNDTDTPLLSSAPANIGHSHQVKVNRLALPIQSEDAPVSPANPRCEHLSRP
eukprot:2477074-Pyramimonas_sp.AAC.3